MTSPIGTAVRGAIAGGLATVLMDLATEAIQQRQSPADREREEAARPEGKQALENLVDRVAAQSGMPVGESVRGAALSVTHYALGVIPGALYALLRRHVPLLGAGHGLVYGTLLWLFNDEIANTVLRLSGPPTAYPVSSHARGLGGHIVLGIGTDIGIDVLDLIG